jgi:hypothetical protein
VFARKHGVHGAAPLVGQHGERFGVAVLVVKLGEIRFPRLTLPEEEHGRFGNRPA